VIPRLRVIEMSETNYPVMRLHIPKQRTLTYVIVLEINIFVADFYVLLTVHLSVIFVISKLNAQNPVPQ